MLIFYDFVVIVSDKVAVLLILFQTMRQRVTQHLDELERCDFVSEVDLDENDLRTLAVQVRRDADCVPTRASLGRLLLAAVGCAMRDYDELGFWHHFLSMLPAGPGVNQAHLRTRLQEALVQWKFLDAPRHGPHSTVTPILNQAGVTPRAMPAFADLLRDARESAGSWNALCGWSLSVFLNFLDSRSLSRALRDFLGDEEGAGWQYTRAVANRLEQWECGLLDEETINGLRGYRRGFWSDLREKLGTTITPRPSGRRASPPLPRLIFDSEHGLPALVFAGEWVQRRAYRWAGRVIHRAMQHFTCVAQLETSDTIECQTAEGVWTTRSCPRWSPQVAPVAFFHHERGYIQDPAGGLPPGDYDYLSFDRHMLAPSAEICRSAFEEVPFEDNGDCRHWHLTVSPGADLRPLGGGMVFKTEELLLSWGTHNSSPWECVAEAATVWSGVPRVVLRRPEDFSEGQFALFVEVAGEATHRLEVPPRDSEGGVEIVLPLTVPTRGRLWVEPLGRVRMREECLTAAAELHFILLPEGCSIRWPRGLFPPGEQPTVELQAGSTDANLELPGCTALPTQPGRWQVPAWLDHAAGELKVGSIRAAVRCPMRRAGFFLATQREVRIVSGDDLTVDGAAFVITGLPMQPVKIGLVGEEGSVLMSVDLVRRFDAHGRLEIFSAAIRDAFRGIERAATTATVVIWDSSGWVGTGTVVVARRALAARLFDPATVSDGGILSGEGWTALHRFIHGGARLPGLAEIVDDTFSLSLRAYLREVWCCAWVFGADDLEAEPARVLAVVEGGEVGRTLLWVIAAHRAVADGGETTLLDEYARLTWHPTFGPWNTRIEHLAMTLRERARLDPWLVEWSAEVRRRPRPAVYRSHLATVPGGAELTQAYYLFKLHRAQNHQALAFERLVEIRDQAAGVVRDLALILEFLIRLRVLCDPGSVAARAVPTDVHPRLAPILARLRVAAGGAMPIEGLSEGVSPGLLPLPEIDVAFLEGFSLGQTPPESDPPSAFDERNRNAAAAVERPVA